MAEEYHVGFRRDRAADRVHDLAWILGAMRDRDVPDRNIVLLRESLPTEQHRTVFVVGGEDLAAGRKLNRSRDDVDRVRDVRQQQ